MNKAALLALVALAVLFAACGPAYVPPANNTNKAPTKAKKDYKADFDNWATRAFTAQDAFMKVKGGGTPDEKEKFFLWTEAMCKALKYARLHESENGEGSTEGWKRLSGNDSIKMMKSGFWKNEGAQFKDEKRVKDALHDAESGTS